MKKYTKIVSIIIGFLLFTVVTYATVTTANSRKSSKLPWQGTLNGFYDAAHNVGTSYVSETRFTFDSGTTPGGTSVVKDNITGLYWQSSGYPTQNGAVSNLMTWASANTYCANLTQGGYSDWRLPNFKELYSIEDLSRFNPSINTTYFSSNGTPYWSSTIYANNSSNVLVAHFYYGESFNHSKTINNYFRCVR